MIIQLLARFIMRCPEVIIMIFETIAIYGLIYLVGTAIKKNPKVLEKPVELAQNQWAKHLGRTVLIFGSQGSGKSTFNNFMFGRSHQATQSGQITETNQGKSTSFEMPNGKRIFIKKSFDMPGDEFFYFLKPSEIVEANRYIFCFSLCDINTTTGEKDHIFQSGTLFIDTESPKWQHICNNFDNFCREMERCLQHELNEERKLLFFCNKMDFWPSGNDAHPPFWYKVQSLLKERPHYQALQKLITIQWESGCFKQEYNSAILLEKRTKDALARLFD
jgi:hypothetical protein